MGDMVVVGAWTKNNKFVQYMYNLVVAFSQLGNTLLGGHPDTSISEKCGYRQYKRIEKKHHKLMRKSIDSLFLLFLREKSHCLESLLGETNSRGLSEIDNEIVKYKAEKLKRSCS